MNGRKADKKRPLILIGGPTGIGKSDIAEELARILPGEIINADSRQFYKEIPIGTDSPLPERLATIPYHCIGFLTLEESFTAHDLLQRVEKILPEIRERGVIPIITGGSGLYFRALRKGFFRIPNNSKINQEYIRNELEKLSTPTLYQELVRIDPEAAQKIHPHDRVRIRRAIEIWKMTGKTITCWKKETIAPDFLQGSKEFCYVFTMERKKLHTRIETRVEEMVKKGWIEEVRSVAAEGFSEFLKVRAPIGYKEILDYLEGKVPYQETLVAVKQATKEYAKKQETWFRKESDCIRISLSEISREKAVERILRDVSRKE